MKRFALVLLLSLVTTLSYSQNQSSPAPLVFIYDASGSMWGQMEGNTKMEIASDVLTSTISNLNEGQEIGLVAYGHRKKGDCRDVEELISMENQSKEKVSVALKSIKPLGRTPLAYAAELVIAELKKSGKQATIILITDGIESCDGDLCAVVTNAKAAGIDFKLHIVGFGLKEGETKELRCAANAGGGNYYDAADAGGLSDGLNDATQQSVGKPSGNFTLYAVKNGKPIDAYVKAYDVVGKRNPIAGRTYRDTAKIFLPPSTYNIEVKPLEGSKVAALTLEGIKTKEGEIVHKDVSFDGGTLRITTNNNGEGWDSTVRVIDQDGKQIGAGENLWKTQRN